MWPAGTMKDSHLQKVANTNKIEELSPVKHGDTRPQFQLSLSQSPFKNRKMHSTKSKTMEISLEKSGLDQESNQGPPLSI